MKENSFFANIQSKFLDIDLSTTNPNLRLIHLFKSSSDSFISNPRAFTISLPYFVYHVIKIASARFVYHVIKTGTGRDVKMAKRWIE